MAFAMQLAAGKVELEKCPHVSEQAKSELAEASQPPILKVQIGEGDNSFTVGEENVLFRHDRTFINQNGFAVTIEDTMDAKEIEERVKQIDSIEYERVGQILTLDAVCIKNKSGDGKEFKQVVQDVSFRYSQKP
ncbi:MAG: hypothetical protein U5N58_06945 [Actinomycetota bacterium]|nr:hypothetical protein [Actinomycetota bacterium]